MEQKIIRASKEIDVQYLWSLSRLLSEVLDLAAGVDLEAHRDHRLDRQPERGRIDISVESADDTKVPQPDERARIADAPWQRTGRHQYRPGRVL
jgi:hypothetical protein